MSVDALLSRLEGVRKTGVDRWIARAPTRPDKHPSLSIRELPDGRLLLHDHGGDPIEDILAALDLTFEALYPEKPLAGHSHKRERRPFSASDALVCLSFEVLFLGVVANDLAAGKALDEDDRQRLWKSAGLIAQAQELCCG